MGNTSKKTIIYLDEYAGHTFLSVSDFLQDVKLEINFSGIIQVAYKNNDDASSLFLFKYNVINGGNIRFGVLLLNRSIIYLKDGKIHREDGPAFNSKHSNLYMSNGVAHRIGGPAYISMQHDKYFINGIQYTKEEYDLITSKKGSLYFG